MKIEIGESLIVSWLKHAKNCQIVQMNWKPSVNSWELYNEDVLEKMIRKTEDRYLAFDLNLFKNSSSVSQIILQGEIDVLGMEIINSQVSKIYGVDIAFHENGLQYGAKLETVSRVLKKMVRTAVTLVGFFDTKKADIIFATPKIHTSKLILLEEMISDLNEFFNMEFQTEFNFRLISNESFKEDIFDPVINLSGNVADTSELFMRSLQLYNLFNDGDTMESSNKRGLNTKQIKDIPDTDQSKYNGVKVGALVRSTFPKLVESDLLSEEDIERLQEEDYSKYTFDLNYPFIKKVHDNLPVTEQRQVNNHSRYYSNVLKIKNERYLITSEWYSRSKTRYVNWLELKGF